MTKRLIFYSLSSQSFYSVGMDKEDSYNYPQHQEEPQNFMTTLLNNPAERSELHNHCDSTHLKEQEIACEQEVEQEENSSMYRDILNKQLSNNFLPENPFQEPGEQSILMITPQSKKTLPEPQNSSNKNLRVDKQLYQQESRKTKIQRYLNKKPRRIWGKKVSYVCRKQVADNRQRKNGRFIKKSPLLQEKYTPVFPRNDLFQMFQEVRSNQSQRSIKSEFALQ